MKLSKLRYNPNNPRFIRDENFERLKLKIVAYPKFLNGRGIVYDSSDKNTVLGGNQRLRVLRELSKLDSQAIENIVNDAFDLFDFEKESSIEILSKLAQSKEIPKEWLFDAASWSEDEKKSFVIIDNVEEGEHDFDILANTWDSDELNNFGVFIPNFESEDEIDIDDIETSDDFTLKDGDREPFQQMTFTFADEQAEFIKQSIKDIKQTEDYKYMETLGNENSNGNALYLIVQKSMQTPF